MSSGSVSYGEPVRERRRARSLPAVCQWLRARPELAGVLGIAAILNLWGLSINGWANTFYSAAVRSMAGSWHDFLFASLDRSGLMTVDKPPLALWVQALSVRVFGFHPLSILAPQALMGVAAVGLVYDLVRRYFGRPAGVAAGLVFALTPISVAIARHNNPDQLLILCCVAALWFGVRALQDGRTRWLAWCGVCVGLGFETKMAVALFVVPGIALAYLWVAPRGRLAALRQLSIGGLLMAIVGLAWPVLVTLTPAADRPWISGTSDNSIWSLIFNYNGLGRVTGQTGAPGAAGGGAGGAFGGATGAFRLLQSGLGDQAGWLLGFALVAGLGLLVTSRLRRLDPRTGWLIAVGGAFAVSALVFSFASGIFHPYYVSFLAPFTAALVGAGVGLILGGGLTARIVGPCALAAGIVSELVVLGNISGALSWAKPLVIALAGVVAVLLAIGLSRRVRGVALAVGLAALLVAPATWAAQTLGHATSATFPSGGPASASAGGFGAPGGGGPPGFRLRGGAGGGFPGAAGGPPGAPSVRGSAAGGSAPAGSAAAGPAAGGGMFGADSASLNAAVAYGNAHGGGTIGVQSQSGAAAAIVASGANVAGLGGFSGRESSVTASWIAMEVKDGRLRWVLTDSGQGGFAGPRDSRQGSAAALDVIAKACKAATFSSSGSKVTMYDCQGKAAAILAAARRS